MKWPWLYGTDAKLWYKWWWYSNMLLSVVVVETTTYSLVGVRGRSISIKLSSSLSTGLLGIVTTLILLQCSRFCFWLVFFSYRHYSSLNTVSKIMLEGVKSLWIIPWPTKKICRCSNKENKEKQVDAPSPSWLALSLQLSSLSTSSPIITLRWW